MQTEITTGYVRKLQQQFRERNWETIVSGIRCLNPSLSVVHDRLRDEIKKDPYATEYRLHIGTLRTSVGSVDKYEILEEFLNCYSTWMDRYVPCAHVEVDVSLYKGIEIWFVFSL
jgi:hypothetical protein